MFRIKGALPFLQTCQRGSRLSLSPNGVYLYRIPMRFFPEEAERGVGVRFFGGEGTPTPECTRPGTTVHQGMHSLKTMKGERGADSSPLFCKGGYCLPVGI